MKIKNSFLRSLAGILIAVGASVGGITLVISIFKAFMLLGGSLGVQPYDRTLFAFFAFITCFLLVLGIAIGEKFFKPE